ncbi:hypothetical protein [Candidatus Uabimicrobium sp. HlEnr_7]|uniref:hypothetical protein n=1 Tax=Candidatus Uabimicrobium helgolandensis TaxID=3095367 RepID=UPI003556730E
MNNCDTVTQYLQTIEGMLELIESTDDHFYECTKCWNFFEEKMINCTDKEIHTAFEKNTSKISSLTADALLSTIWKKIPSQDFAQSVANAKNLFSRVYKYYVINRSQLPAAAGSTDELQTIPSSILYESGLEEDILIVCKILEEGYEIRIQGSTAMTYTLLFMKDKQQLLRFEVSEQIPEQLISPDKIRGWTHIRIQKNKS